MDFQGPQLKSDHTLSQNSLETGLETDLWMHYDFQECSPDSGMIFIIILRFDHIKLANIRTLKLRNLTNVVLINERLTSLSNIHYTFR